jgi:arylsulfatase A-like enzyme
MEYFMHISLKPNILFLLIDGLRSDRCYGNKKTSVTPHIDSLIQNGLYFNQAICSAPVTFTSLSSLFTGLHASEAVILNDEIFTINQKRKNYVEHLKENGYTTYAFLSESAYMGPGQIFKENVYKYPYTDTLFNGNGKLIVEKLKANSLKEPWFYYLHFYDLYVSSVFESDVAGSKELNNKKYGNNKYERILSAMDVWIGKILDNVDFNNTLVILTADHATERGDYDSNLEEYAASWQKIRTSWKPNPISRSVTAKKIPKILQPMKTYMAKSYSRRRSKIVKDRIQPEIEKIENEDLSPYYKRLKKSAAMIVYGTFDDRFHIPLCFSGFGITSKHIISDQVRSIDIFPTVMDIIDLKDIHDVRGRSLLPYLEGKKMNEVPVLIESISSSLNILTTNSVGIRTSEYKYFRDKNKSTKNVHLYDLIKDPLEERNLADRLPDVVKKMENTLNEIQSQKLFDYEKSNELNDDETQNIEKELRKLGYIN